MELTGLRSTSCWLKKLLWEDNKIEVEVEMVFLSRTDAISIFKCLVPLECLSENTVPRIPQFKRSYNYNKHSYRKKITLEKRFKLHFCIYCGSRSLGRIKNNQKRNGTGYHKLSILNTYCLSGLWVGYKP